MITNAALAREKAIASLLPLTVAERKPMAVSSVNEASALRTVWQESAP
jgi:hypothetical protein